MTSGGAYDEEDLFGPSGSNTRFHPTLRLILPNGTTSSLGAPFIVSEAKKHKTFLHVSPRRLALHHGAHTFLTIRLRNPPSSTRTVEINPNIYISTNKSSLVFTPSNWNVPQTVVVSTTHYVPPLGSSQSISFSLKNSSQTVSPRSIPVNISNSYAEIDTSPRDLWVPEGETRSFSVVTNRPPSETITVNFPSPSNTDLTIDADPRTPGNQSSLTFTADNWRTPQIVAVTAGEDDDAINEERLYVDLVTSKSGTDYLGGWLGPYIIVNDNDLYPIIESAANPLIVAEGGSSTFTVRMAAQIGGDVWVEVYEDLYKEVYKDEPYTPNPDVTIDTDPGTAGNQTRLRFTPENWDIPQTVTVYAREDDDDLSETASRQLRYLEDESSLPVADAFQSVEIFVADNDAAGLVLSTTSLDILEGDSQTFTVVLAAAPTGDVTVNLAQEGTVNEHIRLDQSALIFTRENWSTPQTVRISIAEDHFAFDYKANLSLMPSGGGYDNLTRRVAVSVENNAQAGLELSASGLTIPEGDSGSFTVRLGSQPPQNVTVTLGQEGAPNTDVNIDTDTDTPGSQNTLRFTNSSWDIPQTVTVTALRDDDTLDDRAVITLKASGADYDDVTGSLAVSVAEHSEAGLILSTRSVSVHEGGSSPLTLRLKSRPSADVTVTLTQPSNIDVTLDTDLKTPGNQNALRFTTSNWSTAQAVTLSAAEDDDAVDDSAAFSLAASGGDYEGLAGDVSVTVTDHDTPGLLVTPTTLAMNEGGSGTLFVRLGAKPKRNRTIALTSNDAGVTLDQSSLTFTPDDWDTPQTVTVSAAAGNGAAPENTRVQLTAFGGGYLDETEIVVVDVREDGQAGLMLSSTALKMDEGGGNAFTVRLATQPSADVTVTLSQGGAINQYVTFDTDSSTAGNQAVLTFTTANWNRAQTVTVRAFADNDDAANDSVRIRLTASGGGYGSATGDAIGNVTGTVAVAVADDDTALALSTSRITMHEGDSKTFTVQMSARPAGDTTVGLHYGNPDMTLSPTSLDFTSADWNSPQTVTVSARPDSDRSNDRAMIRLSGNGVAASDVEVVVMDEGDDDSIGLALSATSLEMYEGDTATLTVKLTERPANPRIVTLTSSNPDAAFYPAALSFSASNWNTPQRVIASARHDADRIDETARVSVNGPGIITASIEVTIFDDEAGARHEVERSAVKMLLAEVASGLLSSARGVVSQRLGSPRGMNTATVAGARIGLDRSIASDLAAGFARHAGARGASSQRFEPDRFGSDHPGADWLGGVQLERGRPVRRDTGTRSPAPLPGSFSYSGAPGSAGGEGWSLWGRTGSEGFTGAEPYEVDFDGRHNHLWVGIDRSISRSWLFGMALGLSSSEVDYTLGQFAGNLKTDTTMFLPYLEITGDSGASGRLMFGVGVGEIELVRTTEHSGTVDFAMQMVSASGSRPAVTLKNSRFSWSGDAGLAVIEPDETQNPALMGLRVESMRVRGGMEFAHDGFGELWIAEPQVGLLLRYDAGDGVVGAGIEVTAGLRVRSADSRFSLGINLRSLELHSDEELSNWGAGVQFRLNPLDGGRGLSFSLGPHWGTTQDGLLERDQAFRLGEGELRSRQHRQQQSGMQAGLAYGLGALGGLLTPYSEYRLTSGDYGPSRRREHGVKFSDRDRLEFRLFSERQTSGQRQDISQLRIELQRQF